MGAEYDAVVMEVGDQIAVLNPSKAEALLAYMKEKYNIEPPFSPPQKEKEREPEKQVEQVQTEWSVILTGYDANNKVGLVKTYRELSGVGLKEAMAAIVATATGTPLTIKEGLSKTDAEKLKAQLEAASGKVELK